MTLPPRSKKWNTMVDILDGQFPKGECKERGQAMVMLAYIEMMLNGVKFTPQGKPIHGSMPVKKLSTKNKK
jgi:hypothetical protein